VLPHVRRRSLVSSHQAPQIASSFPLGRVSEREKRLRFCFLSGLRDSGESPLPSLRDDASESSADREQLESHRCRP